MNQARKIVPLHEYKFTQNCGKIATNNNQIMITSLR